MLDKKCCCVLLNLWFRHFLSMFFWPPIGTVLYNFVLCFIFVIEFVIIVLVMFQFSVVSWQVLYSFWYVTHGVITTFSLLITFGWSVLCIRLVVCVTHFLPHWPICISFVRCAWILCYSEWCLFVINSALFVCYVMC